VTNHEGAKRSEVLLVCGLEVFVVRSITPAR
jgi:hypothetical protein